ncbi:MAG: hypothetical protein NTV86_17745 [Planctomycetota bacterium]|nr:hypothetical protein [Planctomycetota bacterium]
MGKKRLHYDDEALVEMISEGQMTYKAIGQKLGISGVLVKLIAQGRRRKELGQKFWDAENGILAEARRIAAQYARHMLMEQIRLGLRGEGEPARRAREFVLKFAVSARPRRADVPGQKDPSPEWMLQMSREMGIVPWEDELAAEREQEAVEEEARNGEGITAENAENAEGEEGGDGEGSTAENAEGAEGEEAGKKATGNRQQATGVEGGRKSEAGLALRSLGEAGAVATAASMPATGVFPGPDRAAGPEAASRPAKGVVCDGR